jgi:hypothetical protein
MAGSGGTFCFSDEEMAIDVDAATFKALAFENFKIAFEQIHSETSEDEWKENFSEDSDFESRPQRWFGSDLDSGGPTGRLDGLAAASVHMYQEWNLKTKDIGTTKSNFKCNGAATLMLEIAREMYRDWLDLHVLKYMEGMGIDTLGQQAMRDAMGGWGFSADEEEQTAKMAKSLADKAAAEKAAEEVRKEIMGEFSSVEFREQCFLLSQIFKIQQHRIMGELTEIKPIPYHNDAPNACLMIDGNPYAFMNKLTQYPTQQTLMDITTAELSNLQPRIRLFKVITNSKHQESSQEMNFDAHATSMGAPGTGLKTGKGDLELMLDGTGKRGFGAGIKEFTFAYEANNPFALKKSITAKLVIFANTFDELLRDRAAPGEDSYRYVDLALKTGGANMQKRQRLVSSLNPKEADVVLDNLSKLDFRLKAVVGLESPVGGGISNASLLTALSNSFVTLNLTPTTHQFEFDDMGRVTFTINYLAYVEDFFDQPSFSIFGDRAVVASMYKRQLRMKAVQASCDSAGVKAFQKEEAENVKNDKNKALTSIILALSSTNKLRYINLPVEHISTFLTKGPYYDLSLGVQSTVDVGALSNSQKTQLEKEIKGEVEENPEGEDEGVPWWAWGFLPVVGLAAGTAAVLGAGGMAISNAVDREAEAKKVVSKVATTLDSEQITFFYVSDLVDVILKGIEDRLKPESHGQPSGMHALIDELTGSEGTATGGTSQAELERLQAAREAAAAAGDIAEAERIHAAIEALHTKANEEAMIANEGDDTAQAGALLDIGDLKEHEKERFARMYSNFKKLRVVLGPVEIVNPRDPSQSQFVNFGDMPISVKYFMDWLTDKTIKKDQFYYPLPRFLNDFFNRFISDFLNNDTCFGYSIKQKTRVNQASVTGYRKPTDYPGIDSISAVIIRQRAATRWDQISRLMMFTLEGLGLEENPYPIINISGYVNDPRSFSRNLSDEFNYLVYFAGRTQPTEKMNGNVFEDSRQGIMHYMMGRDVGIIKNISLNRTDSPGLKEVRFEQEGYDGLNQLREVYDVSIDTYANVSAFPGTYIFVDPRGFVPNMSYELKSDGFQIEDLSDYGLGGYYMVIRSEHTFGPGKANTEITAKWVSEIHKNVDQSNGTTAGNKPAPKPTKCFLTTNTGRGESSYAGMLSAIMPSIPGDVDTGETGS